jgi:catechol 2,3-dioxygenase-like lactoylglutathione lyase family enzyme
MLANKSVAATIGVKNLQEAKSFYKDMLGLAVVAEEGEELVAFKSGGATLLVYRSKFAGTNKATAATWMVGADVDEIVRTLKSKGISFLHYDMPGMTREGDVHVGGGMRVAWFTDPEGNILNIASASA